jgi:hypothetical protein
MMIGSLGGGSGSGGNGEGRGGCGTVTARGPQAAVLSDTKQVALIAYPLASIVGADARRLFL